MAFKTKTFKELHEGDKIKHPARGKDSRVGEVISVFGVKEQTSILVKWDEGGVSKATQPHAYEILAQEPAKKKDKE